MGKPARQKGTSTPRSRGAYGSTRGKERQKRRTDIRMRDPRYKAAQEEAAQAERELEALSKKLEGSGPAAGAAYGKIGDLIRPEQKEQVTSAVKPPTPITKHKKKTWKEINAALPAEGPATDTDSIRWARSMLRQGYTVAHVHEATGVGTRWLSDIDLDSDGHGLPMVIDD